MPILNREDYKTAWPKYSFRIDAREAEGGSCEHLAALEGRDLNAKILQAQHSLDEAALCRCRHAAGQHIQACLRLSQQPNKDSVSLETLLIGMAPPHTHECMLQMTTRIPCDRSQHAPRKEGNRKQDELRSVRIDLRDFGGV